LYVLERSTPVAKKLTILIDDAVYEGLHRVVGRGGISKFIENLARPHVAQRDLGAQYREAARDAAREREAQAWSGESVRARFPTGSPARVGA
jgi:predicted CopG family antitoxin